MTTLRDRLRADTAQGHDRVDRAYGTLDLTRPGPLALFLAAQLAVLRPLRCRPGPHAEAAGRLGARMIAALRADLRPLGGGADLRLGTAPLDATAVLYVLLGSTLGTRVLRRRWLAATDPAALGAGRYLGLAPPPGAWRALCDELAAHPSRGAEADRVVGDAAALFDRHVEAWAALSPAPEGALHA